MDANETEYQYDLLQGIGFEDDPAPNGHASQEEQFIPLLDVIEDDNKGAPKLEEAGKPKKVKEKTKETSQVISGPIVLPWARASRNINSPSLRLHNEIVEFCRFLDPTPDEDAAREDALQRISGLITSLFPTARVQIFGSYLTGLYLPTSDMDLVVTDSGVTDIPNALRAIGNTLVSENMGKRIQVIAKAKVPIVKFDDVTTGLAFDISFDIANGPKTAEYVLNLTKQLPAMSQLVKILKLFLQQRELNEVYQGGLGSYALITMVAAFLLQHPSRYRNENSKFMEGNLGLLLLDFFRLYGRELYNERVAVSCKKSGVFFCKRDKPAFIQAEKKHYFCVEDPQDPDNDLTKGSFNIARVQKAFDFAYQQLSTPIHPEDSALERIIRLDAVLLSRCPPQELAPRPQMEKPQDVLTKEYPKDPPKFGEGLSRAAKKRRREREKKEAQPNYNENNDGSGKHQRREAERNREAGSSRRRKRRKSRDF